MSYSYFVCENPNKKCYYNIMNFDKYFNYLNNLVNDENFEFKKINYICNYNNGYIKECCNPNDTQVINDKYIKIINNGYQICKCNNNKCKNIYCKDFKRPSKYQLCKTKSNNVKKINDFVFEINNNNLMNDCVNKCNYDN